MSASRSAPQSGGSDSAPAPATRGWGGPVLDRLYAQHRATVFRYCCRLLGNASDAEDAVQETFAGAAPYLESLTGEPLAYLTAVARRVCGRELSRRRRMVVGVSPETSAQAALEDDATTRVLVEDVLDGLSVDNRRVLSALAAGFSYADIARALSVTVTTVSTGVWRARRRARDLAGTGATMAGALLLALTRLPGRLRDHVTARFSSPETTAMVQAALGVFVSVSAVGVPALATGPVAVTAAKPQQGHVAEGVVAAGESERVAAAVAGAPQRTIASRPAATPPPRATPTGVPQPASPLAELGVAPAPESQTWFSSSTDSAQQSGGSPLFAGGASVTCARPGGCPQLFRSTDDGATWQNLGALGYPGGDILLPPGFPADPTIFATNTGGLARSDDDGRHFTTVLQAGGPVAVDPFAPVGDARVFMATANTVVYRERTGSVIPGFVLSPTLLANDVTYSGDSQHVDISGFSRDGGAAALITGRQEVERCSLQGECITLFDAPAEDGTIWFAAPPVRTGLLVAWTQRHFWVSRDDGRSFGPAVAVNGWIGGVSLSASGLAVAVNAGTSGGQPSILESWDGGMHLVATPVRSGMPGFTTLLLLPSGRLLAGGQSLGIHCSSDGGATWSAAC